MYKVKRKSPSDEQAIKDERQPLGEHSFGKPPSNQSLLSSSNGSGSIVKDASVNGKPTVVTSGSSDSDKTSS